MWRARELGRLLKERGIWRELDDKKSREQEERFDNALMLRRAYRHILLFGGAIRVKGRAFRGGRLRARAYINFKGKNWTVFLLQLSIISSTQLNFPGCCSHPGIDSLDYLSLIISNHLKS